MSGPGYSIGGHITRGNMSPPLSDLQIQVDPYWLLLGDQTDDASTTTAPGVQPGLSVTKKFWADSPYVAGKQMTLATPDNSTLSLRLICNGDGNLNQAMTDAGVVIAAITEQFNYQVVLSYDSTTLGWNCYRGDYEVALSQLWFFGYLLPLYITADRDPTPISGPV